jgi:uncharacterized protein (UPF0305 family)
MYIQNQSFSDEETLIEQLFDFGLGTSSQEVAQMITEIDNDVRNDQEFLNFRSSVIDEEERMELDDDVRRIALSERLMTIYPSFVVENNQLFGAKGGKTTLLYSIDLF